jgi:hypothetical protein
MESAHRYSAVIEIVIVSAKSRYYFRKFPLAPNLAIFSAQREWPKAAKRERSLVFRNGKPRLSGAF